MAARQCAAAQRSRGASCRPFTLAVTVAVTLVAPVAAEAATELRLRANGALWTDRGLSARVSNWEEVAKEVGALPFPGLGVPGWQLVDTAGLNVSTWEDISKLSVESRVFSVVPAGKLFQWNPRPAGESFEVPLEGRPSVRLQTVAHSPRVFLLHDLFSEEEADFLIERAKQRTGENALAASGLGFRTSGPRSLGSTRTSSSAFDSDSQMSKDLMKRAFEVLRVPFHMNMADGLQILRYEEGQAYISHRDWFSPNQSTEQNFDSETGGSNRWATVFLYLRPPSSGGYTVFPGGRVEEGLTDSQFISTGSDKALHTEAMRDASTFFNNSWEIELTGECFSRLAVKPVRLGAAVFYHQDPMTGKLLDEARHGACPSLTGTKWGANLWIWNKARHLSKPGQRPEGQGVQASFVNAEPNPVDLQYSTDDGLSWVHFTTIEPGRSSGANTFVNHHWRFTAAGGSDVLRRTVIPEGSAGTLKISTRSPNGGDEL